MRGHVIVGVMTISTDVDKLYDTDLTDAAWALIAPMLPAARPGGRPRKINIPTIRRWSRPIFTAGDHTGGPAGLGNFRVRFAASQVGATGFPGSRTSEEISEGLLAVVRRAK